MALFLKSMKAGRNSKQNNITECSGPRWCRPGISRSTSGRTETRNNKGMFIFTFRILDAVFPDKYPRAKCPTAYMVCSFSYLRSLFMLASSILPVLFNAS